jgi:hypothetical protein
MKKPVNSAIGNSIYRAIVHQNQEATYEERPARTRGTGQETDLLGQSRRRRARCGAAFPAFFPRASLDFHGGAGRGDGPRDDDGSGLGAGVSRDHSFAPWVVGSLWRDYRRGDLPAESASGCSDGDVGGARPLWDQFRHLPIDPPDLARKRGMGSDYACRLWAYLLGSLQGPFRATLETIPAGIGAVNQAVRLAAILPMLREPQESRTAFEWSGDRGIRSLALFRNLWHCRARYGKPREL